MGRQSDFTQALGDTICDRIADGESLRAICDDEDMPNKATVFRWLAAHEVFRDQYARAREAQADSLVDDMLPIADDARNDWMVKQNADGEQIGWQENGDAIRRSQIRLETRKWIAARMQPKKYGDKLDLNHGGSIAMTPTLIFEKINAVVGLLERQRQDPKGYARTPKHEDGAEVATAVLRYVLDEQRWAEKSPIAGLNGAVDGIGGIELTLEPGDQGDTEVGFEIVDPSGFFYDPTSTRADFSDAGFMGIGKWANSNELIAAFPDKKAEIESSADRGSAASAAAGAAQARRILGQPG